MTNEFSLSRSALLADVGAYPKLIAARLALPEGDAPEATHLEVVACRTRAPRHQPVEVAFRRAVPDRFWAVRPKVEEVAVLQQRLVNHPL